MYVLIILVLFCTGCLCDDAKENSVLCDVNYCKNKQESDTPIVCQKISKKCKEGKGYVVPSPITCNCCDYCIEHLDEGDVCSVGSPSGMTANAICGPGLFCDPSSNTCVKFVEMSEVEKMPKCVKAQYDYDKKKLEGTLGFLEARPFCNGNGEYEPYQCVPGQICYCVDKDGNRIYGEADFNSSPQFVLRCACSRAYRTAEIIFGRKIQPGEHFRCSANGDFEKIQCIGDKCLCVDQYDGSPLYPEQDSVNITDINAKNLKCVEPKEFEEGKSLYKDCEGEYIYLQQQVENYKKQGYESVFSYKFPSCGLDGGYNLVQENEEDGIKYCAHSNGTIIENYKVNTTDRLAKGMDCKCAAAYLITTSKEKPQCEKNGNYKTIQCRRGKCFCVNNDGQQIKIEVDEEESDTLSC